MRAQFVLVWTVVLIHTILAMSSLPEQVLSGLLSQIHAQGHSDDEQLSRDITSYCTWLRNRVRSLSAFLETVKIVKREPVSSERLISLSGEADELMSEGAVPAVHQSYISVRLNLAQRDPSRAKYYLQQAHDSLEQYLDQLRKLYFGLRDIEGDPTQVSTSSGIIQALQNELRYQQSR